MNIHIQVNWPVEAADDIIMCKFISLWFKIWLTNVASHVILSSDVLEQSQENTEEMQSERLHSVFIIHFCVAVQTLFSYLCLLKYLR